MKEPKTDGFRVLPSYYDVLRELPDAERLELYDAMFTFGFTLDDPNDLSPVIKSFFTLIKPTLEKSVRFFSKQKANGMKGGAPAGNQNARKQPKNNPNSTQNKRDSESDSESVMPKRSRFAPPTLDEVQKFCQERGNTVDAEQFCAFYESKGWRVGNQPMKSWQAAVLTWERRERKDREEQKAEGTSAYEHEL